MKTGIFGGTFSPIHNGHIRLAKNCMEKLELDRVLFIPTGTPPHKTHDDLPSGLHRCNMVRLALEDIDSMQMCDIEQHRSGSSYSLDTVQQLREMYPQDEFYFIMGSDMFLTLQQWHCAEQLIPLITACTMEREGDSPQELDAQAQRLAEMGGRARVLHAKVFPVSSTDIRRSIAAGCIDPEKLGIDGRVLEYIRQNSLYGTDVQDYPYDIERLRRCACELESPERFEHSLNVALRAQQLGRIHSVSPKLLYIAGLLHDICKNMPRQEQLHWLEKSDIMSDKIILDLHQIWHGPCAAVYIWEQLGVYNIDILSSIRYHTTGKAGLSLFDKVLYLADLTSAERDYPDIDEMRRLAESDVEQAMRYSLVFTLEKLRRNETPLSDDSTAICREYGLL